MGDVLRTTPLLPALRKKYPGSKITWLVEARCRGVLEKNPFIDTLCAYSQEPVSVLKKVSFDLSVNLDKEPEALGAMMAIPSKKRMGFGLSDGERLCALDSTSDYAYRLGIDDELKFRQNKKTYQEITFEQLGLEFHQEEYIFSSDPKSKARAKKYLEGAGFNSSRKTGMVIGLNTGAGRRFAGKRLPISTYLSLIEKFSTKMKSQVLLLGGRDEVERNAEIARTAKFPVINTGSHPIQEFAAIVRSCDLVISGDTTALHIAIAVKVPVVTYFGSTCAQEIELYGRGKKIISNMECAPCYKRVCPIHERCMKETDAEALFQASAEMLEGAARC